MSDNVSHDVISEMIEYYRARAQEYDEWFYRQGRYSRGEDANQRWFAEADIVRQQLLAAQLEGDVLELAPGTGIWTEQLLKTAAEVTAIDASPEMIAMNGAKVGAANVAYIQADLFTWRPERTYDAVFFGFWISHVPSTRLENFAHMVAGAVRPGGKIFFVDSKREDTSTAREHILPAEDEQVMKRILNDGREFQIVKIFYSPETLANIFREAGFDLDVQETPAYFIYGSGTRKA